MQRQVMDEIYAFLKDYLATHGYPPTVREVAEQCKLSRSAALRHLERMEQQGQIARRKGTARGITLLDDAPL